MIDLNLTQIITKPTHTCGNTLDFLLTNSSDAIFNYQCTPTIFSDHFIIDVTTHMILPRMKDSTEAKNLNSDFDKYNFHSNKIDWAVVDYKLNKINWSALLKNHNSDPDQQYNVFLGTCISVIENTIPLKKPPKRKQTIPRDRRILFRKRRKLT